MSFKERARDRSKYIAPNDGLSPLKAENEKK